MVTLLFIGIPTITSALNLNIGSVDPTPLLIKKK